MKKKTSQFVILDKELNIQFFKIVDLNLGCDLYANATSVYIYAVIRYYDYYEYTYARIRIRTSMFHRSSASDRTGSHFLKSDSYSK